jgi:uncharacterized protein (DUF433 family)
MSQQRDRRIVTELLDQPHIKGRRVTVLHVFKQVHDRGLSPEAVADRLEVDIADVHRALAYYHEHPDEMAAVRQRRRERADEFEDLEAIPEDVDLPDPPDDSP